MDGRGIVAQKLESLGYSVHGMDKKTTENGVDLIATFGDKAYSIEVKRAGKCHNGWRIMKVSPNRENDDIIAIVVDMKHVLFFDMKEHLKLCDKRGVRYFTKLAKFFTKE